MSDNITNDTEKLETPKIPDGIGLSFDVLKTLLKQENNTSIDKEDPLLLVATMMNAFLHEYDKLLKKHNEALTAFYGEQIKTTTDTIIETAKKAAEAASAVDTIKTACDTHAKEMNNLQSNIKCLTILTSLIVVIHMALLIIKSAS
jgi:hypothetical protein